MLDKFFPVGYQFMPHVELPLGYVDPIQGFLLYTLRCVGYPMKYPTVHRRLSRPIWR